MILSQHHALPGPKISSGPSKWYLDAYMNHWLSLQLLLGAYFELNRKVYPNNSSIPLIDIGKGDSALLCNTDNKECCGTPPNRLGEFYYPNGFPVQIAKLQHAGLNRREGAILPTGRYRCGYLVLLVWCTTFRQWNLAKFYIIWPEPLQDPSLSVSTFI